MWITVPVWCAFSQYHVIPRLQLLRPVSSQFRRHYWEPQLSIEANCLQISMFHYEISQQAAGSQVAVRTCSAHFQCLWCEGDTVQMEPQGLLWAQVLSTEVDVFCWSITGSLLLTLRSSLNTVGSLERETQNMPNHVLVQFSTFIRVVNTYRASTTLYCTDSWGWKNEDGRSPPRLLKPQSPAWKRRATRDTAHSGHEDLVLGPEKKWLNWPGGTEKGSRRHWWFYGTAKICQAERGPIKQREQVTYTKT